MQYCVYTITRQYNVYTNVPKPFYANMNQSMLQTVPKSNDLGGQLMPTTIKWDYKSYALTDLYFFRAPSCGIW